jgi:ribosomal protein L11 methyltransferase
MEYTEVTFQVHPQEPWTDLLADALGSIGFESFMQQEDFFLAYIQKKDFDEEALKNVWVLHEKGVQVLYKLDTVPNENWNKKWEENFHPVKVDDRCLIRATFHESEPVEYEIVIDPKMAFGTGHHDSTFLMVRAMMEVDFTGKRVLDMGSGTGVLAILAKMRNSGYTKAVDNNDWAYESTLENVKSNGYPEIEVVLGDIDSVQEDSYEVVLANINRNIVIDQMPVYARILPHTGLLLTSGFFEYDAPLIKDAAREQGFSLLRENYRNDWAQLVFEKM